MASSILDIGKTALNAAQVGMSVTGHNIANASTPGYTRQVVIQGAAQAQNFGYGYVGQGTQVLAIQRIYNEILSRQYSSSLTSSNEMSTYAAQMSYIDNLLSNSSAGLSPVIQNFFDSVQTASSNPGDPASRQTLLSQAQSLASRFQALGSRLAEIEGNVNAEVNASVGLINSYSQQLQQLNKSIEAALNNGVGPPNDLMDQRDQIIAELSKQIKVDVVAQEDGTYNVFIGNGQPLVVGKNRYTLSTIRSESDPNRMEVGYNGNSGIVVLGSHSLSGGKLGGLVQFREKSLDTIRGQLGMIAVTLAETFNAQHMQGYDKSGNAGGVFFNVPGPVVSGSVNNTGDAVLDVSIDNASALNGSNYRLSYDGSNYILTQQDTGAFQTFASMPQTVDGLEINITSGSMQAGDSYLIKPTIMAANGFSVAISDINQIALAELPTAGSSDNGNALKLAALQSALTTAGGTTSYEGAYSQLVSLVGNKTNELKVMSEAEAKMLEGAYNAQQAFSGVNLDEEAANLMRYQQAYQAAGKMMQIASQLFELLLTIGR
ncbi:MAG: flagellar hook-associated protein FlgK [Betaproteobacteria bacterium HGW-Betaproteobacteria-2]|nr:MAG: flagellar hook-associated protein FlgK [Betaproteobacteria bacterium HGW-Betaproteobacteria-2]